MGILKILGGVALGVGAVAAAPFTGGGSLLGAASLASSLAGAGVVATAAGAAGGAAGLALSKVDEDDRREERNSAHNAGFNQGVREGNKETAKKFAEMLEADDNYRIGTFALAVCVANADNDFANAEEERGEIERYLGRPDSVVNKNVCGEFEKIFNEIPSFAEVKSRYLERFTEDDLKELDNFVKNIIYADRTVSMEELQFLDYQWVPYLKERGVA